MKEKIKELLENKYMIAGAIALIAIILIIIILLTAKGCNSDNENIDNTANETTLEKDSIEETILKNDSIEETSEVESSEEESQETTTLEPEAETTENSTEISSEINIEETTVEIITTQAVAQTTTQKQTTIKATENNQTTKVSNVKNETTTQKSTVQETTTQKETVVKVRTRDTEMENQLKEVLGIAALEREFEKYNYMYPDKQNYFAIKEVAEKFCSGKEPADKVKKDLCELELVAFSPEAKYIPSEDVVVLMRDITGINEKDLERFVLDLMIDKFNLAGTGFNLDCYDFEAFSAMAYFHIYDEVDGTKKMYIVCGFAPYAY